MNFLLALLISFSVDVNAIFLNQVHLQCSSQDQVHRVKVQNMLSSICDDMCKEVGAYPNCAQCPGFVVPDGTPGLMTWEELLRHMDNLVTWGDKTLQGWRKHASALQRKTQSSHSRTAAQAFQSEEACLAADLRLRSEIQDKLTGPCEQMCKDTGYYPSCPECRPRERSATLKQPQTLEWDGDDGLLAYMDRVSIRCKARMSEG